MNKALPQEDRHTINTLLAAIAENLLSQEIPNPLFATTQDRMEFFEQAESFKLELLEKSMSEHVT